MCPRDNSGGEPSARKKEQPFKRKIMDDSFSSILRDLNTPIVVPLAAKRCNALDGTYCDRENPFPPEETWSEDTGPLSVAEARKMMEAWRQSAVIYSTTVSALFGAADQVYKIPWYMTSTAGVVFFTVKVPYIGAGYKLVTKLFTDDWGMATVVIRLYDEQGNLTYKASFAKCE